MKEGRQHGLVKRRKLLPTPGNSRPGAMIVNGFDSPPTARFYGKVPSRPSNYSKFMTGKHGRAEAHILPVCKSRDKGKSPQKIKSCDDSTIQRSIALRIIDEGVSQNFSGVSATGLLSHLSGCLRDDADNWIDDDDDHDAAEDINEELSILEDEMVTQIKIENKEKEEEEEGGGGGGGEGEDDDAMGFYAVGFVWDTLVDEGDWCLVGEM